jgi:hypothetical protein
MVAMSQRPDRPLVSTLIATLAVACGPAVSQPQPQPEPVGSAAPPSGVEQLLPRGAIPAITDPVFVAAGDAEIPDDAWVLGVALGGEARAYSLSLLDRHEVVNDAIGPRSFAAVW